MKSSLGKLRKYALHRSDEKEKKEHQYMLRLDELAQASQDMQDMRNCYDNLLSAAAATTNSAYEFSESLRDMGACLLEKTALNDDGESYKILSILGEVQFELQKLVDTYRSHIILTITTPSESLLKELRTVEEMRRQCDEKRNMYEYMVSQHQEKGKSRGGKGESLFSQQLQAARHEYDEVVSLCVFRLKSLKQGQCRSLLTQAARHHAAQMNFFRKGLQSLEAIEPHLKQVTEKQHIDYQLSGIDDGGNGEDGRVNSDGTNGDGELSFDYRRNKQGFDAICGTRNSMEGEQPFNMEPWLSSYSAPIFPEKNNPSDKIREKQQASPRKSHSYVLPTPNDAKNTTSTRTNSTVPKSKPTNLGGSTQSLWHSSPLEPHRHDRDFIDNNSSVSANSNAQSKLKKSSNVNPPGLLVPSSQGPTQPHSDAYSAYDGKKPKRQAFSGPLLTSKPSSTKPLVSVSGPISSTELPHIASGLLSRIPIPQPLSCSPKVSPGASPPIASSPKISELHELPRPPVNSAPKPVTSSSGHSAPLVLRNQEPSSISKTPVAAFGTAAPLPTPPLAVPRSFSIPSSSQRAMALHVAKLLESPQLSEKAEDASSPPLTPISLSKIKPLPTVSEVASHSEQLRS